jgi:ArsR family transcriptional regulator
MTTTTLSPSDTVAPAACCAPLGAPSLSDEQAEATARLFKALADPHRIKIINLLATSPEPVCVCEFTGPLGARPANRQPPPQETGRRRAARS